MGPLAKKLIAEIEKQKKQGRAPEVLHTIARPGPIEVPSDLPPGVFLWMRSYQYLVRIASGIMGSSTLRRFTELVRITDEEYLPHGPPDSPITDSFFFGWWAIDRRVDTTDETIATMVVDLAKKFGGSEEDIQRMRELAGSHLRVVRIDARDGATASLSDLVTGERIDVGLPAPWDGSVGDLWLARVMPEMCFTPYALDGEDAEKEWREYFERTLGGLEGDELSRAYREHMRGDPDNYWLEYILDGFASGNQHTIHLEGVPDRPETLPHSDENFSVLDDAMPLDPRDRLMRELMVTDLLMDALSDFMAARESFELPELEPDEDTLLDPMLIAYASYGIELEDGRTFLEHFLEEHQEDLEEQDLADLRSIATGWFTVLEVKHVKLDQGIEARDVLRKQDLWIEERAATRQIALGDVLAAWVQDYGGRIVLEGSILHFPRMMSEAVIGFVTEYCANLPEVEPWRTRLAAIVPVVAALHETTRERPPVPAIFNEAGEEMVLSQARYLLKRDVTEKLEAAGWEGEGGSYVLAVDDSFMASVEIEGERLRLFATSPVQLRSAKEALEEVLGGDAVHQTDVFEDAQVAMASAMSESMEEEEDELTPQMKAELRSFLMNELTAWLDTPIPMLGNRTPREAVRDARAREDVKMMLLEQERLLAGHDQLDRPLDFRPLWESLGLEYPS
jgi:hypothetical protein